MLQPFLFDLSRSIVKDRDLLKPRMKITPYNQHWRWLLSRALVLFVAYQSTRDEPTSLCNQPEPDPERSRRGRRSRGTSFRPAPPQRKWGQPPRLSAERSKALRQTISVSMTFVT